MKPSFKTPGQMIAYFMRPYWRWIVVLIALLLLETWVATLQPLVMAPMVDIALEQENIFAAADEAQALTLGEVDLNNIDQYVSQLLDFGERSAWQVVLILSGAFVTLMAVKSALATAGFFIYTRVRVNSLRHLQAFVFGHLLSLEMGFHNYQRSGELVARLDRDTRGAINALGKIVRALATAPLMIILYSYLLITTDLTLMLLISLVALTQWVVVRLMKDRLRNLVRDEFDLIAGLNAYLQEVFQNIRVVKSFAAEDFEQRNMTKKVVAMVPVHINRALFRYMQDPIVTLINGIANVSILLLSTRELFNGSLTVTGFFLFLYLGRQIIGPISSLGTVYLNYQEMEASAQRVFEMTQRLSTIQGSDIHQDEFKEGIEFRNVSFAYGDEPVLEDVSLKIEKGSMVALVGPSGAGKSTLTDLVMRFYDPTAGEVLMDGLDLRELNVEAFRRQFGVVNQENLLFNATIGENIAYGRDDVSREQIERAAKIANAAEFIAETPEGYQTMVGDRGLRLSGGQRQRVAIARAIVHEPKILILDEATSSLDTESERLVQNAIDRVIRDTTAIVVAHRLSTVIHADKIIVLDEGRVLDQGKHDELLERSKLYRRLCELQFQVDSMNASSLDGEDA